MNEYKKFYSKKEFSSKKKEIKKIFREEKKQDFISSISKGTFSERKKSLDNYLLKYKFGLQNSDYAIEVKNIYKFFKNGDNYEKVLENLDLKIESGKIVCFLGPSGSGKTTLMNIISGLIKSDFGETIVLSKNLSFFNENKRTKFRNENISFVFQSYNLINTLKCKDNILLGSDLQIKENKKIDLESIASFLNISDQLNKYPYQLSGGQKQRVSIARALVKNPKILLADEPTGALDDKNTSEVLKIFKDIRDKYNTTIVLITHDYNVAKESDQIIKILNGKILENFSAKYMDIKK